MNDVYLKLPLKSEFVLIARLVSSGYSARLGIDLEKTEDIKVVLSEILNKCIIAGEGTTSEIKMNFFVEEDFLCIRFELKEIRAIVRSNESNDLGFSIIKTLCDRLEFDSSNVLVLKFYFKENK